MNLRIFTTSLLASAVFGCGAIAAETKTDLARDVFVENSTTNFVLTASPARPVGKAKVTFDLSAPVVGPCSLVCFIDGKPSKPVDFTAPGAFTLSTRGLAPGTYRLTLQLLDRQGGVGRITTPLEVK